MTKKEEVKMLYDKFREYTETAEQHEFPILLQYDMLITRGYDDLQVNWNEEHADKFIRGLNNLFNSLGVQL